MKRHQIDIWSTSLGKTCASCSTCGRKSKQGTVKQAEAWMFKHQDEVLRQPKTGTKR